MEVDSGVTYVLFLMPKKLAAPHSLVDVFLLFGVQVELAGITQVVGFLVGKQRGSVVAAHLINTGAEWCGTVVVADNHVRVRSEAAFKVRTHWSHQNQE